MDAIILFKEFLFLFQKILYQVGSLKPIINF
jgi:hypothetical protein